jgi:branched-subunit amino acid transport protein AzlD
MTEWLLIVLAVIVGELLCRYLHGLIFSVCKADKYEDLLARKISIQVINALKTGDKTSSSNTENEG